MKYTKRNEIKIDFCRKATIKTPAIDQSEVLANPSQITLAKLERQNKNDLNVNRIFATF